MPLALPPIAEQHRIVAKLDELFTQLDAAVEALYRVKTQLARYRQSVLKATFEGKALDEQPDPRGSEARLTDELPALPPAWRWSTLGEAGQVSGGITKNARREKLPLKLPYLRVANVYADELRLEDVKEIGVRESEVEGALLQPGDLLVVEGNGSQDQIGRVALWDGSVHPCLHQNHIIKVRFGPDIVGRFALYWLLSPGGRAQITRVASSTSGLYTLSISKVASLPLPIAPLAEQRAVVEEIEQRFSVAAEVENTVTGNLRRAERLRQSILKRAFAGRLVPQDPNDEPAEILLERIRAHKAATAANDKKARRKPQRPRRDREAKQERLL